MIVGPLVSVQLKGNGITEYDPTCDMQLTNVALDGTAPGRTVVKIHYIESDPYEDEDSDFSDEDDEDEEDDEEDDEAMAELKADRSSGEPKGEERTIVLCSLYPQTLEQVSVNFVLPEGEAVEFIVEGPNNVHILGNYINQPVDAPPRDDYDDEFGSDLSSDEGGLYDPETGLPLVAGSSDEDDDSLDEDEMSEDGAERFEELKESPAKAKASTSALPAATAKPAADDASMELDGLSKNQRKKLLKKAKADAAATSAGVPAQADVKSVVGKKEEKVTVNGADGKDVKATAKKQSKKTTLPSGVIVEDIKMGDGPAATAGKKVSIRYIGKLQSGKQFDANTKGKPFEFKLGKGEVVKGMDAGVEGMRPGGERRLTLPPSQAYGKAGTDGIPGNSVLIFEVKLLSMK